MTDTNFVTSSYPLVAEPGKIRVQRGEMGTQDKVRIIYNPNDAGKFDVAYHNPKRHADHRRNLDLANYRPAGYYGQN
jgi:hypothetical protein